MANQNLFSPIVEEAKLNPFYKLILENPTSEPARIMMELIFQDFSDVDGNFVEQFQTTGFDARIFELYLNACFASDGFKIQRDFARPDFLLEKDGVRFALEATTSNPNFAKQVNAIDKFLNLTPEEIDQRSNDEIPIRLGSPLFSKLKKKYWELEHCKEMPFVIAIEAFHDETALLFSDYSLAQYLFGLRQYPTWSEEGNIIFNTQEIESHQLGEKIIPSNFFKQPDAEYISAILFSNSGTYSKFNRMGYQAGFHKGNINLMRFGGYYIPDKESTNIMPFHYDLDDLDAPPEEWGQGITYIHNPNALYPLPKTLFPNAGHIYLEEEKLFNDYPTFHPQTSQTYTIHFGEATLDFPNTHIASIYKNKFISLEKGKKQEAELLFEEKQWFADSKMNIIGALILDRHDKEWAFVIFGKQTNGIFHLIEMKLSIKDRKTATAQIIDGMENIYLSGQLTFD